MINMRTPNTSSVLRQTPHPSNLRDQTLSHTKVSLFVLVHKRNMRNTEAVSWP